MERRIFLTWSATAKSLIYTSRPKNEFIEGPDNLTRKHPSLLRICARHLVDALLWEPIPAGAPVLFEEKASDRP